MKIFRRISIIAVFALPFVMSAYVLAQTATKNSVPIDATVSKPSDTSYGEVRKIDKEAGKLTLRHGKIENIDMPPMTMVFRVNDKSMLDKIKVGERWPRKFGQAVKWKICYHYRPTMGTTWSRKWQKEPNGNIHRHSKQKQLWQL